MPTENDFELVKVNVPDPKEGEFLVRNIWMSVRSLYARTYRETKSYIPSFQLGKPLEGGCVGQIIESKKNNQFKVGEYVLGNFGWREYWLSNGSNGVMKIDPEMAPIQWYLGIFGMTGLTAYVGLLKIGELKEANNNDNNNTAVFVSAASGAVGSVVCQIAKIKGCRVVGSAGSQEKVKWLLDELE